MSTLLPRAPIWVSRPLELYAMLQDLLSCSQLGVDTESNSLYAYSEQVCLIQFSTGQKDYLVDPLELDDLSLLGEVFANPAIEKIFHAAEYDVICLRRDFNFHFVNLFDTMQAARILGRSSVGLAAMLKEEFGVELDKRYQRANWGRRPLPPDLLAYARLDTHYLIPLRHRLRQALEDQGLWPLAEEDFRRLAQVSATNGENHLPNCWRVAGQQELTLCQAGVLNALCEYRDQQARAANLPPFKVLNDQVLLAIALACPRSLPELAAIRGLSPRQIRLHGNDLLDVVQRGMLEEPPPRHCSPKPSEAFLARLEALRAWRKQTGEAIGVPSDIILPRDVLEQIAEANPKKIEALAPLMADLPYRLERFGGQILAVLQR